MKTVWKLVILAYGLPLMNTIQAHASWINMTPTTPLPFNANWDFDFGDMISCRVFFQGGIHPGWTTPNGNYCTFGWGGRAWTSGAYQLWVDDWEPASNGNVPANAIPLGYETYGPAVLMRYACVALSPAGRLTSGKTGPNVGFCDFPWGGVEQHASSYRVLVDSSLQLIEATGGPKLTVNPVNAGMTGFTSIYYLGDVSDAGVLDSRINSGFGDDGKYLALCSAYFADGYHPGYLEWSEGGCTISFGGVEFAAIPSNIEVAMNWQANGNSNYFDGYVPIDQPIPYNPAQYPGGLFQSAIVGGEEADGTHFYLCAGVNNGLQRGPVYGLQPPQFIPGKLRAGLGGCSVGVNGKETIVPEYRVLMETYTKPTH
jgi:hypothetical protein